jgi:hypothetical protein
MAIWTITNKQNELLLYNETDKKINYYPKDTLTVEGLSGRILIKSNGGTVLDAVYTDSTQDVSSPSAANLLALVEIVHGYLSSPLVDQFSGGWADYNDFTTIGTPITVTGGAGNVALTNDGAGVNTNTSKLPFGVPQLWDASTNKLDFTGLSIGDWIDIRSVIDVIVATNNTQVEGVISLGSGGSAFTIPFIPTRNYKTTGPYILPSYIGFYIGSQDVLDSGGQIMLSSDTTCTVTVEGWAIKAIKIGG